MDLQKLIPLIVGIAHDPQKLHCVNGNISKQGHPKKSNPLKVSSMLLT